MYYPPSTDFQQGVCPWFVNGIFELMDRIDPVYHCDQIGACRFPIEPVEFRPDPELTERSQDGICSTCEQMVQQAVNALESPDAIDDIRSKLASLCEFLKIVGQQNECQRQVDKYLQQLVDFIHNIDPRAYCQSIHLCGQNGLSVATVKRRPERPLLADFSRFGIETNVKIDGKVVKSFEKSRPTPNCILCKTIVKEVVRVIKDNRTEANIENGLDKVCNLIFRNKAKQEECEQLVEAYSKEIIEILTQEADPNMVCILLEQCTYKSSQPNPVDRSDEVLPKDDSDYEKPSLGEFMTKLDSSLEVGSLQTCLECKMFIKYIREQIDKPHTEESIKKYLLEELCENLEDAELKKSCRNLVNNYADIFFKAVIEELNPQRACEQLDACKKIVEPPKEAIVLPLDALASSLFQKPPKIEALKPNCGICREIVNYTDRYIALNPFARDLDDLIVGVCEDVSDRDTCTNIMNRLGLNIYYAVRTMDDHQKICTDLEYC